MARMMTIPDGGLVWSSLGALNQEGDESGGAFGIGKDAPLAGSQFRTVLYSTRTLDGRTAFQGVCRLVTHKDGNGELTQGTGFIGNTDTGQKLSRALRDFDAIPQCFRRTEPGLDVWILGSRHSEDQWSEPFIRSALANFWPAIGDKKITFEVGHETIDDATLGKGMRTHRFDDQVADELPFYRALVDQHAKRFARKLPYASECRLHLLTVGRDLPKKVRMVRRTGMVIDMYRPQVGFLPFAGLFICEGHKGNRLLRSLEPPRHDKWDPARASDPHAAQALSEIKKWIREIISQQTPHSDEDQFNESEVPPDLLEDLPENPITDSTEFEPDLGGTPKDSPPPQPVKIKTRIMRKTKESGEKGAGGDGDNVENPTKGDQENTGGRKGRDGERDADKMLTPKPNLTTRAFCSSDADEVIELVLRTDNDYEGNVWIEGVGDDGSSNNLPLESAENVVAGPAEVEQNKIKDVKLAAGETVRFRLRLKQPGKYAVRATLA